LNKIRILPDQVIKQIAAGEVVQRPSSVVKELVENALDAGAQRIEIQVEKAGSDLISVRDDGCGMTADDAILALRRHATSKIATADDLISVSSLGFRGEALPSIAAVSEFQLITAKREALSGVRIRSQGGSSPEISKCQAVPGTWISVHNLFFNTPARLKFLKTERTELRHITEVITRLAVVRPDVSFRALSQGRELITTSGAGERKEVVELILGKGTTIPWITIDTSTPLGRLSGYVAPAEFARRSRNHQITIINGRWVKSPLLSSAIGAAFEPQLVRNCHPVFCLELEIEPKLVDINVHPAKLEVRLSQEREVWQFAYQTIKAALYPGPAIQVQHPSSMATTNVTNNPLTTSSWKLRENHSPYTAVTNTEPPILPTKISPGTQLSDSLQPQLKLPLSHPSWPQLSFIGQVLQTYLVAESEDGVYLVDQHAAHERILYEQIGQTWEQNKVPLQHLLVPQTFTVTEAELALWKQKRDLWQEAGIVLEEFGINTLVLRSVPQIMSLEAAVTLTQELLEEDPNSQGQLAWEQERQRLQATLSCHAALKSGQNLTIEDADQLLNQLKQCKHPYNCPHGRPTMICLTKRELDRRFLRRLT